MKVLQINSVCGIGSTGRIATDIHSILMEQEHESYIAYGRGLPKNCENTIRIGTKFDNYTHVVKTRLFDMHGFGSRRATIEFIDKVKQLDPDIIHLHNIHGYYINIEILFNYLKGKNKPVLWTFHDCWAITGHCAHFDYIGCDKWKNKCHDCPQKKGYPASIVFDNSKFNYDYKKHLFTGIQNLTIVTPSKWLGGLVKESFLGKYPIKVINNGIDLGTFKPTKNNFREINNLNDKFIILGVANVWGERKGLDYFIELSNHIGNDEAIVIVGLSQKQKKGLPKNIIGITRTNNASALAHVYTAADVFINPTLEETLGMTSIESLACGTPVITFNTGGCPESIDENCGLIVEKGNFIQLKDAIRKIKSDGKEKYAKHCLIRANEKFDKMKRYNEYIRLYEKIFYKGF